MRRPRLPDSELAAKVAKTMQRVRALVGCSSSPHISRQHVSCGCRELRIVRYPGMRYIDRMRSLPQSALGISPVDNVDTWFSSSARSSSVLGRVPQFRAPLRQPFHALHLPPDFAVSAGRASHRPSDRGFSDSRLGEDYRTVTTGSARGQASQASVGTPTSGLSRCRPMPVPHLVCRFWEETW
jgi:hypothetical protein